MEDTNYYKSWLSKNPNYLKEYKIKNREKMQEYQKEYQKKYIMDNKEKLKEYHKKYTIQNKENIKKYYKQYYKRKYKCKNICEPDEPDEPDEPKKTIHRILTKREKKNLQIEKALEELNIKAKLFKESLILQNDLIPIEI